MATDTGTTKGVSTTERGSSALATSVRAGEAASEHEGRWLLIRDVLRFQLKLFLDGLMDLFLGPLAAVAAFVGLLSSRERARELFYEVIRLGSKLDEWINLYGLPPERDPSPAAERHSPGDHAVVDDYMARLEKLLREQCDKGGVTRATKERIDTLLDGLHRGGRGPRGPQG